MQHGHDVQMEQRCYAQTIDKRTMLTRITLFVRRKVLLGSSMLAAFQEKLEGDASEK